MNLTKREQQVFLELLNDAKTSDQKIAQKIGTSRPTVLKVRKRLEKAKLIERYTAQVNYELLGYEIIATTLFRWDDFSKKKELEKFTQYINGIPYVLRFDAGQGIGSMTHIIVSVHRNLRDYESFWEKLQEIGSNNTTEVQVFLSTWSKAHKSFDLTSPVIHILRGRN